MTANNLKFVLAERLPDTKYYKGAYCYDVLFNEAKIAQWRPMLTIRGYTLMDLAGRTVRAPYIGKDGERSDLDSPWHWHNVECKAQGQFAEHVEKERDYIPTPEQIARREADEQAKAEKEAAEEVEAKRIERIKEAGPLLLAALNDILFAASNNHRVNQLYHDAGYCACCEAIAPKDVQGNLEGKLNHREGCIVGDAVAVMTSVRGM
jgi:hypothetical protein